MAADLLKTFNVRLEDPENEKISFFFISPRPRYRGNFLNILEEACCIAGRKTDQSLAGYLINMYVKRILLVKEEAWYEEMISYMLAVISTILQEQIKKGTS